MTIFLWPYLEISFLHGLCRYLPSGLILMDAVSLIGWGSVVVLAVLDVSLHFRDRAIKQAQELYMYISVVACTNLDCSQSRWLGCRVPHSRPLCHHTRGILRRKEDCKQLSTNFVRNLNWSLNSKVLYQEAWVQHLVYYSFDMIDIGIPISARCLVQFRIQSPT